MIKFNLGMRACGVFLLWATAAVALPAQTTVTPTVTFTTLHRFDYTDGFSPEAALVQATNGDFYGTTAEGGASLACSYGCGTVFKITPVGRLTTLHSFDIGDGDYPDAVLIQATNGDFYGTTVEGGANNAGTVFKITTSGTLTTLYSFCPQTNCTDGANPYGGLVQGINGNLYGATSHGGANNDGTVFKITPSGTLTTLHSFDDTDAYPNALVQATDGSFYGTTSAGGAFGPCTLQGHSCGTVFKITPSGMLTTLHSFDGTDGSGPVAGLVQGTDGNFYGTTFWGGANSACTSGCGTVFSVTPKGKLTTLHSFDGTDGNYPEGALIQATDGNFYGTTVEGGANLVGTIFKITPTGALTTLYSLFCSQGDCTDGASPYAGLVQGTNGNFYGTAGGGNNHKICPYGCGTIFSLSVGLK
jgi:uncharacterized repeat protein (TIGR03803 family)